MHFNIILVCTPTFARYPPPLLCRPLKIMYKFFAPPSPCLLTTITIWGYCTLLSFCRLCTFLHSSVASCVFTPYSLKLVALNHIQSVSPAPSPAPPPTFLVLRRVGPLMSLMSLPPEDRLMSMGQWRNDNDRGWGWEIRLTWTETCPLATLSTTNSAGSKPSSSLWEASE